MSLPPPREESGLSFQRPSRGRAAAGTGTWDLDSSLSHLSPTVCSRPHGSLTGVGVGATPSSLRACRGFHDVQPPAQAGEPLTETSSDKGRASSLCCRCFQVPHSRPLQASSLAESWGHKGRRRVRHLPPSGHPPHTTRHHFCAPGHTRHRCRSHASSLGSKAHNQTKPHC